MHDPIKGSFPGGPTRPGADDAPRRAPRIRRVADIEAGRHRRAAETRARRRRIRLGVGIAAVISVAFGIGIALGMASHTTAADMTAEQQAAYARDRSISSEVNRVLLELWRMEDVEHARNAGRTR